MKLIVGLGNPGSQYERTRHNVGFMALDRFAQKHAASNFRVAHESFLADVVFDGQKLLLLKPQTFMNLAGRAVASAMAFYKLPLENLLVVVDDVALPAGAIRLRASGSSGGHNGLRDIESALSSLAAASDKTGQDYHRLRIGIDAPGSVPQKDYVLAAFTPEQKPKIDSALSASAEAIALWSTAGITPAMNRFNPAADK